MSINIKRLFKNCMLDCIYAITCFLLWVFERLPVILLYLLANLTGALLFVILRKKRKLIYRNMEIVYGDALPCSKPVMAYNVFTTTALAIFEKCAVHRLINKNNWRNFISGAGIEVLEKEYATSSGAVFVTGHLGAFMLSYLVPCYLGYPVTTLVRSLASKKFTEILINMLNKGDVEVIVKSKNSYSCFKEILVEKKYPVIFFDQHAGRKSLHVDFLGKKAYTAPGPAALARNFQVPIFVGVFVRTAMFHFAFHAEKIPVQCTNDKQADLLGMTHEMNRIFGNYVKQYPKQWFTWAHRRWRCYAD